MHRWLAEGQEEDPVPMPAISDTREILEEDMEIILHRMEFGGYGFREDILRCASNIYDVIRSDTVWPCMLDCRHSSELLARPYMVKVFPACIPAVVELFVCLLGRGRGGGARLRGCCCTYLQALAK